MFTGNVDEELAMGLSSILSDNLSYKKVNKSNILLYQK